MHLADLRTAAKNACNTIWLKVCREAWNAHNQSPMLRKHRWSVMLLSETRTTGVNPKFSERIGAMGAVSEKPPLSLA